MKQIIIILIICLSLSVSADPSPFGLEIGKATVNDLKKKYKYKFANKNLYSGGDMYSIDVNSIGIEGLQKATAIFSKDETLLAIFTTFPKHKFEYLYGMLSKKYKLQNKNIPFVGNRSAKFVEGRSTILIDSPHLSFDLSMNYIDNNFIKTYLEKSNKDQQRKKKSDGSKL